MNFAQVFHEFYRDFIAAIFYDPRTALTQA
jgi:hypothetical protein